MTATFPWHDPLDAVHEENRFQRDSEMLGDEGAILWARFDEEMDRLYATQSVPDVPAVDRHIDHPPIGTGEKV